MGTAPPEPCASRRHGIGPKYEKREPSGRRLGGLKGPSWRQRRRRGGGEDRGFAAPAFAGCAFVDGSANLRYGVVQGLSSDQRAARYGSPRLMCGSQATAGAEPAKGPSWDGANSLHYINTVLVTLAPMTARQRCRDQSV